MWGPVGVEQRGLVRPPVEHSDGAVRDMRRLSLGDLGPQAVATGLARAVRDPLNAAHLQLVVADRRLAHGEVEHARGAIGLADAELARISRWVQDLVDVVRPAPLRRARGDLRETAEVVCTELAGLAADVGIELVLEPGAPVPVTMDAERMKRGVLDLVRRTIEAGARGGCIRVRVGADDRVAHIHVEDEGELVREDRRAPAFATHADEAAELVLAFLLRTVTDHGGALDVTRWERRVLVSVTLPRDERA